MSDTNSLMFVKDGFVATIRQLSDISLYKATLRCKLVSHWTNHISWRDNVAIKQLCSEYVDVKSSIYRTELSIEFKKKYNVMTIIDELNRIITIINTDMAFQFLARADAARRLVESENELSKARQDEKSATEERERTKKRMHEFLEAFESTLPKRSKTT